MEFTYCEAIESDCPQIYKLESSVFTFPHTEEQLRSAINDGHYLYYIAKIGDKIAGYLGIQFVMNECYILNIAVDEEYRGQGISNHLMDWLLLKSKELNFSFVSLEVRASNTIAINLYQKYNFEIISVLPGYYDKPKEDGLIMTLRW